MSRVQFMTVACPRCGSRRCACEGSRLDGRKRYYRCRACDTRFTAWRLDPPPEKSAKDRPDVRTPDR